MQMTAAAPGLVPVGRLELAFDPPLVYRTHAGQRGFLRAASGGLTGPRVTATLADDGGEWMAFRPDGWIDSDARLMLATADGGHLYLRSRGLIQAAPDAFGDGDDAATAYPFRCTPWFEASPGPFDWLSRAVLLGIGTLSRQGSAIDLFEVA
jgi:hypothetical protein